MWTEWKDTESHKIKKNERNRLSPRPNSSYSSLVGFMGRYVWHIIRPSCHSTSHSSHSTNQPPVLSYSVMPWCFPKGKQRLRCAQRAKDKKASSQSKSCQGFKSFPTNTTHRKGWSLPWWVMHHRAPKKTNVNLWGDITTQHICI